MCRTYDDGIEALRSQRWDHLYLDHDLGDPDERKTGYGIMKFLEQYPEHKPGQITLITMNPVGRFNMTMVLEKLYKTGVDSEP